MSWIIPNPFLLINLYWLFSIALAASAASLFFQSIRITAITSIAFGVMYSIIPFVFFRNISHLNLVIFIIPAGAYLALSLARGHVYRFRRRTAKADDLPLFSRWHLLLALCLCLAVGLTYIYWSFFTCIAISLGILIGYARLRKADILFAGSIYVAIIGIASLTDMSASLLYWHSNGANTALAYKSPAETDVYGLRIRQMLSPIPNHPLSPWRAVTQKVVAAHFQNDANESQSSALGTFGTLGFLVLLYALFTGVKGPPFSDPRIWLLSSMAIGIVLIAEVGGIGSLFNIFVTPAFRDYNRISPFLSLFCLGALAIIFDKALALKSPPWRIATLAVMVAFAAIDQIPLVLFSDPEARQQTFYADKASIQRVEALMPTSAMVFQLPDTPFPGDPGVNRMLPYDNARAYLHSSHLRWSWGCMTGRHRDWNHVTARLPSDQFLKGIVSAGFQGILLDRAGFPDRTMEHELTRCLGPANVHEVGLRWILMDLRPFETRALSHPPISPESKS